MYEIDFMVFRVILFKFPEIRDRFGLEVFFRAYEFPRRNTDLLGVTVRDIGFLNELLGVTPGLLGVTSFTALPCLLALSVTTGLLDRYTLLPNPNWPVASLSVRSTGTVVRKLERVWGTH